MRLRDQRGVSLIELLVGIVVFAILFLIVDAVFISAHRGARKTELSADVNQNARIAVERLLAEIRESRTSQIQVDPGNVAVIFRSARPSDTNNAFCMNWKSDTEPLALANPGCAGVPDQTGTYPLYSPVWQRWIAYYFDSGSGQLRRTVSNSALAFPVTGGQVIATSIETFTIGLSGVTFTVALKGNTEALQGTEMVVQGSNVPPQEIVLDASTVIRN